MIIVGQNMGMYVGVLFGDMARAIGIDAVHETVLGGGHVETLGRVQCGLNAFRDTCADTAGGAGYDRAVPMLLHF